MSSNEVLLVTASINIKATPYVSITDKEERLLQYLIGLVSWIKLTNIKTIVFCENTNTPYDFSKIIEFASSQGKILEVILFQGNDGAQKYGKGYGEGKIVEYALENSQYLRDSVDFYKITGRLFIPEFNKIQQLHREISNVFKIPAFTPEDDPWFGIEQIQPKTPTQHIRVIARFLYVYFGRGRGRGPHNYQNHVSTVFYKSNVKFFRKNLVRAYKRVNDHKSYALEHTFYENLTKKDFSPFLADYTIVGKSGASGKLYSEQDSEPEIKAIAKTFC
ncbi:hypothetical protein JOY44_24290 [Phormidium sp. CLA17]|uniref:hypothetical protein n=1 Tax=Leptolyngbya sp. Cla-17 TaxID=2803751 RepID=UPI00149113EF|nr:hypothetical protein [Leptolyngbya sp. Cla-17]MBM0744686.1 hypothetical protein [Leptolyngbya sp. Cla-17]